MISGLFSEIILVLKGLSVILGTISTSISFHPSIDQSGPSQKVKKEVTVPGLLWHRIRATNFP